MSQRSFQGLAQTAINQGIDMGAVGGSVATVRAMAQRAAACGRLASPCRAAPGNERNKLKKLQVLTFCAGDEVREA